MNKPQASHNIPPEMADHFSIFVYLFEHGLYSENRNDFLNRASEKGWRPWICRSENGSGVSDLLHKLGSWFHPPTLEAVYPEIHRLARCRDYYSEICSNCCEKDCPDRPDRVFQKALANKLYDKAEDREACIKHLWGNLKPHDTLRLTMQFKNDKEPRRQFSFPVSRDAQDKKTIPFEMDWIDAYLFPFQVGFLCIKVRLEPETRMERLTLLHQRFRDIDDHGEISGVSGEEEPLKKERFLDKWIAPLRAGRRETSGDDVRFSLGDYVSRAKIFSFISLRGDEEWFEPLAESEKYYDIDRLDALLYESASTSTPGTLSDRECTAWDPSEEYLKERLLSENRISLWRYWRGMALKDTAVFLSLEGKGQPGAVQYEEQYFPLYMYVLNLKAQLFQFSNRLNLRQLRNDDQRIRQVLEEFLMFRNEFWFSEISPNFQMAILFEKFKHGLEVEADYTGVSAEVDDIFKYQESRYNRRLNYWVFVLTVGALIIGFFGMNYDRSFFNVTLSYFIYRILLLAYFSFMLLLCVFLLALIAGSLLFITRSGRFSGFRQKLKQAGEACSSKMKAHTSKYPQAESWWECVTEVLGFVTKPVRHVIRSWREKLKEKFSRK